MPHHLHDLHALTDMPKLQHVNVVGLVELNRQELEQLLTLRPMSDAARPHEKMIMDPTRYKYGRSDDDYAVVVTQESRRAHIHGNAAAANATPEPHDLLNDPQPSVSPPASDNSAANGNTLR